MKPSRLSPRFFVLSVLATGFTNAVTLNIAPRQTTVSPGASFQPLDQVGVRYKANITLNGVVIPVAIDTGSRDLWVKPPGGMGDLDETDLPANISFGNGSPEATVSGNIAVAPLEFGGYSIPEQAFINVHVMGSRIEAEEGMHGVLGLSFGGVNVSIVEHTVTKTYGAEATWGKTILANIFDQNPDKENLIGIALARTDDMEDTADGALHIGEVGEEYVEDVESAARLPVFPPKNGHWSILLDDVVVDGVSIPLTSRIKGTPAGKHVAVLDTGATGFVVPQTLTNAIFSRIPGARLAVNATFGGEKIIPRPLWVVPCLAAPAVSVVFGGVPYPIHPLDLSTILVANHPDTGKNYTVCLSTPFSSSQDIGKTFLDDLWGPSFLRNTYSVFDFGDTKSTELTESDTAFIKLVSLTDEGDAQAEVKAMRSQTLADAPPEIAPSALLAAFAEYDKKVLQASLAAQASVSATPVKSTTAAQSTSTTPTSNSTMPNVQVVGKINSSDEKANGFSKWGPIILGLLAANVLIGLALLVLGIISCLRSRGKIASKDGGIYAPVKFHETAT